MRPFYRVGHFIGLSPRDVGALSLRDFQCLVRAAREKNGAPERPAPPQITPELLQAHAESWAQGG